MDTIKQRTWVWDFDSPVERVWPLLADTARFNEAAGLPRHEVQEIPQTDGSVRYFGRFHLGPFSLEWEEQPVNWIQNRWFRHCRQFLNGPFKTLCAHLSFSRRTEGCRCTYTVEIEPANALGRLLLATGFFRIIGKTFGRLADNAREFARGKREHEFDYKPPRLASGAKVRTAALVAKIEATRHGHGLARKLADYVLERQDVDVWAIRPLTLARKWAVPERHAIELCLEAARHGLLGLRWDLLCPRCRIGKESVPALDQLPTGAHCSSCNIDYEREYSKNVELVFFPASAIRPLDGGEYCLFGPMSTPHIKLHLTLGPDERRMVDLDLPHRSYRLRTLEPGGEAIIERDSNGFPEVRADGRTVVAGPPSQAGTVALHNKAARRLTLIIEERAWLRDALTAHRATALQAFRDLFDKDLLRPGDNVEIDHIALMFTDLKGSTALYERIGDPQAYSLVREHYAIIGKAVREHNGAVVKTIGDAIMGAFADPADALRCAVQLHIDFAQFNATSGKEPITIKLGLHVGRCISVTLNNRLDYYGTVANKAARLESQSKGGDIVISPDLARDPAVRPLLAELSPREEVAEVKGFSEPVRFFRISAETLAMMHPTRTALPQ